jgi:hypothetical protein
VRVLSVYCAGTLLWRDLLAAAFTCIGLYCTNYIVEVHGWRLLQLYTAHTVPLPAAQDTRGTAYAGVLAIDAT